MCRITLNIILRWILRETTTQLFDNLLPIGDQPNNSLHFCLILKAQKKPLNKGFLMSRNFQRSPEMFQKDNLLIVLIIKKRLFIRVLGHFVTNA